MKRWTSFLLLTVFVVLACGLLYSAHVYIARRIVLEAGMPEPWRALGLATIAVLGASLVLAPICERTLPRSSARIVAWPASIWMGFAFLLVVVLLASDAVMWFAGQGGVAWAAGINDGPNPVRGAATVRASVAVGLAVLGSAAGLRSGLGPPRLVQVELELERWPRALDGFRIAQISDIHIGPLLGRRFSRHLTERVNALDADLVAVTGDLVDGRVEALVEEVAPFAALRGRYGVYFVTGNHDHYSDASAWASHVADLGFRVLRNERIEIGSGSATFDLVGVDDHRGDMLGSDQGEDLDAALAGRDHSKPAVLLAHDPSTFKRASQRGIDLQISGHTHGGQIWPFNALVRLVIPWVAGHHRVGGSQLYVSRGSGFWGPPMRLFAPAEITELVLRARVPEAAAA